MSRLYKDWILFLLLLLDKVAGDQVLTGPKEVKQCAGKTIHIVCRYHPFYRDHVKYWCKGYYFNLCTTLIRTDQLVDSDGPLKISDNKKEGFFTIYMKNVNAGDSGWYWCVIERMSKHKSISMEFIISAEDAEHCFVPESTTVCPETETTTISLTTSRLTNSQTTHTTHTTQTTSQSTDSTNIQPEAMTVQIKFSDSLFYKIWTVLRWGLFMGLCFFLLCFILYFELRGTINSF